MSILMAAVLGLIQGVAEFLPISSSGHLSVLQNLFEMQTAEGGHMFFDVLLHLGTLAAVCFVYRQDIVEMVHETIGFFHDARHPTPGRGKPHPIRRLVLMVIIATLPLLVVLPIKNYIEKLYYNTIFIGCAFIFTGFILFLSGWFANGKKTERNMTAKDALLVGIAQAIATIPGISRSGSTITAGMATGLDRNFAFRFSFLLSIPAVLGANLLSLFSAFGAGIDVRLLPAYLIGTLVAMISGYIALKLLRNIVKRGGLRYFSWYCWLVGIVTIVLTFVL